MTALGAAAFLRLLVFLTIHLCGDRIHTHFYDGTSHISDRYLWTLTLVTAQSALFNFQSLLLVIILMICTCTYIRAIAPSLIDRNKQG